MINQFCALQSNMSVVAHQVGRNVKRQRSILRRAGRGEGEDRQTGRAGHEVSPFSAVAWLFSVHLGTYQIARSAS